MLSIFKRKPPPTLLACAGKKIIDILPAAVIPRALELLDLLLSEETPTWQRALVASTLLELVAALNLQIPAAMVIRYAVVHAAFSAGKERRREVKLYTAG